MNAAKFFDYIDVAQYKSLVCLNGDLPDSKFFDRCPIKIVIAVDGAANKLREKNIGYDMVIGDLDSASAEATQNVDTVYLPHQAYSDFQKTIEYLRSKALLPSIVLGINGGYLDHVLHNINVFSDLQCLFYTSQTFGMMINSGTEKIFTLPKHSKISIIGMPSAVVSSNGLHWDLENTTLSFPGTNSCFNRSVDKKVTIHVSTGAALVLAYTEDVVDGWNITHKN